MASKQPPKPQVEISVQDSKKPAPQPQEPPVVQAAPDPLLDGVAKLPDAGSVEMEELRKRVDILTLKRELKALEAEEAKGVSRENLAKQLQGEESNRRAYRAARVAGCNHRKLNNQTALGGQTHSDGVTRLICCKCLDMRPDHEWPNELMPSIGDIGMAQGTR